MSLLKTAVVIAALSAAKLSVAADPRTKAALPQITIDKATTFITKPLRADGYPDYPAALNERMREGVTPENNAALLLQKAFGPTEIPKELRKSYFKQLGIPVLPEQGNYFVDEGEMIRRWRVDHPLPAGEEDDDKIWDEFGDAEKRPWSAAEFPAVAAWLKINEKPLALAIEASTRPRQFFPTLMHADSQLLGNLMPQLGQIRNLANLLVARAMFDLGRGESAKAWQSMIACHRLARLEASNDVFLINTMVGYAINGIATSGDLALLHYGKLSVAQIKAMRAELNALPPLKGPAGMFDTGERFMFLDLTLMAAKKSVDSFDEIRNLATGTTSPKSDTPTPTPLELKNSIDWNEPLRVGNEWYDRMAAAARIRDRLARREAAAQFESEMKKLGERKQASGLIVDFFSKRNTQEFLTPRVTNVLLALMLPSFGAIMNAYDTTTLQGKMNDVAFALAEYRAENKQYPDTLAELVPKYLKEIPEDAFNKSGGPIGYRREADTYSMWSASYDGVDSNGHSREEDEKSDDIVFRPAPIKKSAK
jgi:hypothetical protein